MPDVLSLAPFGLFGLAVLGLVYVASVAWAYVDAEDRGKEGPCVAVMVALVAWPLGLLLWWFVRPRPDDADAGPAAEGLSAPEAVRP